MTTYPGGKNGDGVFQTIINLIPPHQIYIEPFLGSGAIMRKKLPAPIASIGIDADAGSVEVFKSSNSIPSLRLLVGDALFFLRGSQRISPDPVIRPDTFIYLDPPYLMETRSIKKPLYKHEFSTIEEHQELLRIIKQLPCMVMISGYFSELYTSELAGWQMVTYQAQTRSGHPAQEYLWMNYPTPLELHDYRYLGTNFRERERIKRQQQRWYKRLSKMPSNERYALLAVLQEIRLASNVVNGDSAGSIAINSVPAGTP